MSEQAIRTFPTSAAERYDRSLRRSLARNSLPQGITVPKPTSAWPEENVALLERYREWLVAGGASTEVISQHRIPTAGTMLGLSMKLHSEICLDTDTERTLNYIKAKKKSKTWESNCAHSLRWFCRFLEKERGIVKFEPLKVGNVAQFKVGLPDWLVNALTKLLHIRQANWRPTRMAQSTYRYWYIMTHVWRWLVKHEVLQEDNIETIQRQDLDDYVDEMLLAGYKSKTINLALHQFMASLRFLEQGGQKIPRWLLVMPTLKTSDPMPRFLSDEQVGRVKADLKQRVEAARTSVQHRDSRLDLAIFYVLWQTGMRVSELEDLTLEDVSLKERWIIIRGAKGLKDRTVYLTDATARALEAYVKVRGPSLSNHFFIYRHKPLSKDIVRTRIKAAGRRAKVYVTPHMLRHTFATQLINAGCRVTSIQALLGHKRLNTTMIYARVHNETVAQDYITAMAEIEAKSEIKMAQAATNDDVNEVENLAPQPSRNDLFSLLDGIVTENLTSEQLAVINQVKQGLTGQLS